MKRTLVLAVTGLAALYGGVTAHAQEIPNTVDSRDAKAGASFEVATVRVSKAGNVNDGQWSLPGKGKFQATDVPLSLLIELAFGVDEQQIADKPKWIDSELYDINAKPEAGVALSREELKPRLQNLLEQRFHFAFHRETRLTRGYALTAAKDGPRLKTTTGAQLPGFRVNVGPGHVEGINWTMPYLATMLTPKAGLPVVDRTGISGSFDVHVEYAADLAAQSPLPSLFTAVKENLGLELKAEKVPVQMIVIDHVDEEPTPN